MPILRVEELIKTLHEVSTDHQEPIVIRIHGAELDGEISEDWFGGSIVRVFSRNFTGNRGDTSIVIDINLFDIQAWRYYATFYC